MHDRCIVTRLAGVNAAEALVQLLGEVATRSDAGLRTGRCRYSRPRMRIRPYCRK